MHLATVDRRPRAPSTDCCLAILETLSRRMPVARFPELGEKVAAAASALGDRLGS